MKIVIVSTFYSEGMGYAENCLPKALVALGHEVHLVTSNLNVYGNESTYDKAYKNFLGPADQGVGTFMIDGYIVHRLPSKLFFGYVVIKGLSSKLKELSPDIVHSTEIAALHTFKLAFLKMFFKYKLFTESHQHMSVIKPYLKQRKGHYAKRLFYWITRTFPSSIASLFIVKCYAISPDCVEVANTFYGVPKKKLKLQSLGTDTELFKPANSEDEFEKRRAKRKDLGFSEKDIVCIYTGRFSNDKNPLILAKAIDKLSFEKKPFYGLFIGEGAQQSQILQCKNVKILPFVKYKDLANYYNLADIAVWPTQESMSMLDAASCGLPLIVSDKIGEPERINGNGKTYKELDFENLSAVLDSYSEGDRKKHGLTGRYKMLEKYNWIKIAERIVLDYLND